MLTGEGGATLLARTQLAGPAKPLAARPGTCRLASATARLSTCQRHGPVELLVARLDRPTRPPAGHQRPKGKNRNQ